MQFSSGTSNWTKPLSHRETRWNWWDLRCFAFFYAAKLARGVTPSFVSEDGFHGSQMLWVLYFSWNFKIFQTPLRREIDSARTVCSIWEILGSWRRWSHCAEVLWDDIVGPCWAVAEAAWPFSIDIEGSIWDTSWSPKELLAVCNPLRRWKRRARSFRHQRLYLWSYDTWDSMLMVNEVISCDF